MLKDAGKLIAITEQVKKMEREVDGMIDIFIKEMEKMRADHKKFIQEWLEKCKESAVEKKLVERSALVAAEATGEIFSKTLDASKFQRKVPNPYKFPF